MSSPAATAAATPTTALTTDIHTDPTPAASTAAAAATTDTHAPAPDNDSDATNDNNATDDDDDMPFWAKCVEAVVKPTYKYILVPTGRFIQFVYFPAGGRVNDEAIGICDDMRYWNEVVMRAIDDQQYPEVPVPEDLTGFDRVLWRLTSPAWRWRQLYRGYLRLKWFRQSRSFSEQPRITDELSYFDGIMQSRPVEEVYLIYRSFYQRAGFDKAQLSTLEQFTASWTESWQGEQAAGATGEAAGAAEGRQAAGAGEAAEAAEAAEGRQAEGAGEAAVEGRN
ncbi:hypothetical protein FKW77_000685 [Venturia effusa]|uniref:Uncharacterized protein n=1 Tax=Venturia effusa TaxID=50376 RepID=A0A517KYY1_9PEZI|nr:hypothetical protein FKW77_000685 [Venturia effusa]